MLTLGGRTGKGKPVILLGLTGENVTRLSAGEPLTVPAERVAALFPDGLGADAVVVVLYGKTEGDILATVREQVPIREL